MVDLQKWEGKSKPVNRDPILVSVRVIQINLEYLAVHPNPLFVLPRAGSIAPTEHVLKNEHNYLPSQQIKIFMNACTLKQKPTAYLHERIHNACTLRQKLIAYL